MPNFRVKIRKSSVLLDRPKIFDIYGADSTHNAGRMAAADLFGKPFTAEDFAENSGILETLWSRSGRYRFTHKRMSALFCEMEIERL